MVQDDVAIRTPLLLGLGVRIRVPPAASLQNAAKRLDIIVDGGRCRHAVHAAIAGCGRNTRNHDGANWQARDDLVVRI